MSSSCVLPRERVLDLLDELRETMPPEMDQARRVLAGRDALLARRRARPLARRMGARPPRPTRWWPRRSARADELTRDAEVRAHEIVEAGREEHGHLVSATGVYKAAARSSRVAARPRPTATTPTCEPRPSSTPRRPAPRRTQYAAKLTGDAEDYAESTLAELASTLQRTAATAEQGRTALAQRRGNAGAAETASTDAPPEAGTGPVPTGIRSNRLPRLS